MTLYEEVQLARGDVTRLEAELAAAKTRLGQLQAQLAAGGPDVSQHNGDINWSLVKQAGYGLAIVRVADGDFRDTAYTTGRVAAVRSAGLKLGTYQFARVAAPQNGERDGRVEAAMACWFAEQMGALRPGDLPLTYDFEAQSLNDQPFDKCARHLVEFVETYRTVEGHMPVVYVNPDTYSKVAPYLTAQQRVLLGQCPLWIAHWDVPAPTIPDAWGSWTLWQHTDSATVPGISGAVDLNRFSGSASDLQSILIT